MLRIEWRSWLVTPAQTQWSGFCRTSTRPAVDIDSFERDRPSQSLASDRCRVSATRHTTHTRCPLSDTSFLERSRVASSGSADRLSTFDPFSRWRCLLGAQNASESTCVVGLLIVVRGSRRIGWYSFTEGANGRIESEVGSLSTDVPTSTVSKSSNQSTQTLEVGAVVLAVIHQRPVRTARMRLIASSAARFQA